MIENLYSQDTHEELGSPEFWREFEEHFRRETGETRPFRAIGWRGIEYGELSELPREAAAKDEKIAILIEAGVKDFIVAEITCVGVAKTTVH